MREILTSYRGLEKNLPQKLKTGKTGAIAKADLSAGQSWLPELIT
jgi:hypothetical protein